MNGRTFKHNPAFLTAEELKANFAVRTAELDTILRVISENTGAVNQHVLVLGPRGQGKTMLVHRVAAGVTGDSSLADSWLPIVIPEEKYDVATAGELWLEVLGAASRLPLADATRWSGAYDRLRAERDERRLREQCLARLQEIADEEERRLLVVTENLNMLFDEQAIGDMGWDLRETLLNEPRIMLLATATTRFAEIDDHGNALFDLFKEIHLERLSTEDCAVLWNRVTGEEIDPRGVRPMEILTGGNPRLLTVLATFSRGRSFKDLMDELVELIDDHTTYFKANVEALPPMERRVFVALADIWDPAGAREVALRARVDVSKASALLGRLVSRGAVQEVGRQGRKVYYQVAERLYNIYHLLRQRSSTAARVQAVIEVMARFYGPDHLVSKLSDELLLGSEPDERILLQEAFSQLLTFCAKDPDELRTILSLVPEDVRTGAGDGQGKPRSSKSDDLAETEVVAALTQLEAALQQGLYAEREQRKEVGTRVDHIVAKARSLKPGGLNSFLYAKALEAKAVLMANSGMIDEAFECLRQMKRVHKAESADWNPEIKDHLSKTLLSIEKLFNNHSLLLEITRDVIRLFRAAEKIPVGLTSALTNFIACYGVSPSLLDELEGIQATSPLLEPFAVAIRLDQGEEPRVASEILEVARDILEQIRERRMSEREKLSAEDRA